MKYKPVRCFIEGTDWECELMGSPEGARLYGTIARLTRNVKHDLIECGIAEVEVKFVRWAKRPKRNRP